MATTKSWIKAARPRTLPLALSGIIMGCGLAWFYSAIDATVSVLAIVTATLIQVFSNFANDYGDSQRGTDNEFRLGPTRTVQSGEITQKEMETGMIVIGSLSFLTGLWLVYAGTWHHSKAAFFGFIGLGILSLIAAYFYTAGKKSYGYIGLGDLFVFLFFGLLPVPGVFYLNAGFLPDSIFLPALTIGFFSTGVLNLNNTRDIENDRNSGKMTIPVRIGARNARFYHLVIILGGWIVALIFTLNHFHSLWQFIYWITFPIFMFDLHKIFRIRNEKALDPFLKRLALSTLGFTLLFCIGLLISVK
ncbi:1,4-dihydroxy-2-naphthoate prenyltransferase [Tangfeifania diversioriginum]|uniref:1,4-dihydroxy-2-naphthoate octaprenyltransferase n=1 Tax=Tangfeifania diversioriginum TaxID=1168035 RepID=A0A1M6JIM0_9BACT|nr:1,4-dihydroxy-2-naphthoate octaprenyltransferase [Tangfeifania diversioriginum]SHJ46537.1 1,4-dihydroxy-2-naphthoate prenyltransferase [Tangfeifania diversioriginum]